MPELPEVETIRLQLTKLIPGLTIKDIDVWQRKSFSGDKRLLKGARITGLRRLAKMLVIETDKGLALVVHLKMTGQLIFRSDKRKVISDKKIKDELSNKYTRVIIYFTDGSKLFFNDLRRFGWMRIVISEKRKAKSENYKNIQRLEEFVSELGPDPMEINRRDFYRILQSAKKPIKLLLMDQEKLGGVGNIYANEALFEAAINPGTASYRLTEKQSDSLFTNLKNSLNKGIKWGGSSDNNYLNAYGEKGKMQEHFLVYGREGEKCLKNCGGKINRIKLGGRSSFFCPKCQKSDIIT